MSVSGRDAPTTPPTAFANSSTRGRFSFFWMPRPADTMTSAAARSMSCTVGRSIRSNRVRIFVASTATVVGVTVPPAEGPAAFTEPGRIVTTIVRSQPISTSAWTFSFRRRRVTISRSPSRRRSTALVTSGRSRAPATAGARSYPCAVWATSRSRGFVDSRRPRTACTYPSPVYSARAGSSAKRTSTPSLASGSARARTPRPKRATRVAPPDCAARARPAATSSNVEGASRPSRCSATIRISPDVGSPPDESLVRQEGREGDGVDALQSAFELRRDLEPAVLRLDAGDDARVGHPEEPGDQAARRRVPLVVRLDAGQHEVVRQRPDRGGEDPRDRPNVVPGIVHRDADRLVGPLRQGFAQHLLGPLRAGGEGDHPSALFLLEAHRFLEGVLVRAVDLVVQRVPPDVFPVRGDLELKVRIRDLLEAHDDVQRHGGREEETDAISSFPNGRESRPSPRHSETLLPDQAMRCRNGEVRSIVDSPWKSVGSADSAREYLVLLSYLPLNGYRKVLTLMRRSRAVSRQLASTPGLIGFTFRAKLLRHRFWTLSAWEDETALTAFVGKAPHLDAMKVLGPFMGDAAFFRWSVKGNELPLRWDDALRRMPSPRT